MEIPEHHEISQQEALHHDRLPSLNVQQGSQRPLLKVLGKNRDSMYRCNLFII